MGCFLGSPSALAGLVVTLGFFHTLISDLSGYFLPYGLDKSGILDFTNRTKVSYIAQPIRVSAVVPRLVKQRSQG